MLMLKILRILMPSICCLAFNDFKHHFSTEANWIFPTMLAKTVTRSFVLGTLKSYKLCETCNAKVLMSSSRSVGREPRMRVAIKLSFKG